MARIRRDESKKIEASDLQVRLGKKSRRANAEPKGRRRPEKQKAERSERQPGTQGQPRETQKGSRSSWSRESPPPGRVEIERSKPKR